MKLFGILPTPPPLKAQSRVYDLKARLDWGEPALTILDVRDRTQFNSHHIMGAVCMPIHELISRASTSLELDRDIYVYGETDDETVEAAAQLRQVGYKNISELRGGVAAWKAVGYPVESGSSLLSA
ncbi:MAG: rhodanese-like domain-containing protein [Leptolyngbyaceae cyanobacterium RM2_2_4]|nr:rhodanese-like domain-containing protein [Leptolyngbyaceae cyanobacterium SM1_4_3]NJN91835.1 rhodanese-like domain-containing protein [Leptolyngbyaceae cyanobacterium SL_5_14]NJO49245.1 rhodanese-like domain-containing protein [Leptolyngbyaceae cyanobacterium RM2_2_4]